MKGKDNMTEARWARIKALRNPLRVNPAGQSILRFLLPPKFYPFRFLTGA